LNSYLKYTGLGLQMLVTIAGLSFLGDFLDGLWEFEKPWMTILLSLLGVAASMYQVIKSFKNQ